MDSEIVRHRGPFPGRWVHPQDVLGVLYTCVRKAHFVIPPCCGSLETRTLEYFCHRGPLLGGWVHPREVMRAMDTSEMTQWRYPASRFPAPRVFHNTWTPEYRRHRGPLPGGQVLALEVQTILISIPESFFTHLLDFSPLRCRILAVRSVSRIAHSLYSNHFVLHGLRTFAVCFSVFRALPPNVYKIADL